MNFSEEQVDQYREDPKQQVIDPIHHRCEVLNALRHEDYYELLKAYAPILISPQFSETELGR
jgi:hypothetical protein